MMPRKYSIDNSYRYGFNGKENDSEVKGEANQQDYGMRVYDPRLGRFLSVDPMTNRFAGLTPYQFAGNRPIDGIDLDGLEFLPINSSIYLMNTIRRLGIKITSDGHIKQQMFDMAEIAIRKENIPKELRDEETGILNLWGAEL